MRRVNFLNFELVWSSLSFGGSSFIFHLTGEPWTFYCPPILSCSTFFLVNLWACCLSLRSARFLAVSTLAIKEKNVFCFRSTLLAVAFITIVSEKGVGWLEEFPLFARLTAVSDISTTRQEIPTPSRFLSRDRYTGMPDFLLDCACLKIPSRGQRWISLLQSCIPCISWTYILYTHLYTYALLSTYKQICCLMYILSTY